MLNIRKILSFLLFPLTVWYAIIISVRNILYCKGIFKQKQHQIPTICVGNLSTGGTGKTPHVEYLVRLLEPHFKLAILSRGYGRKTKGFFLADEHSTAKTIGDEPLQYFKKFKHTTVAVCENRNIGVETLARSSNPPEVIILDDAFQHKSIIPSLNILLTEYNKPYDKDCILPFGNLREFRSAAKKADIVVYTKCPDYIDDIIRNKMIASQSPRKVFFSSIQYHTPIALTEHSYCHFKTILIFSGIANPKPLHQFMGKSSEIRTITYPDHHIYTAKDLLYLKKQFDAIDSLSKAMITTEKDAMRLKNLPEFEILESIPLFYFPIEIGFSPSNVDFNQEICNQLNKKSSFE